MLFDSNSSHSSHPARRARSRRLWPFQRPIQKSKSLAVLSAIAVWLIAIPPGRGRGGRYRRNRADSARYLCFTGDMVSPTSRLLELLELLQTQPLATGREIADRLGIDRRTVRRYVSALQA